MRLVLANVLEYNLRTQPPGVSGFELAAWDGPGVDLAELGVFWGGEDSVVVLPQPADPEWIEDLVTTLDLRRLRPLATGGRTRSLCADLSKDAELLRLIRTETGARDEVLISAWGATPQLAGLVAQLEAAGSAVRTEGLPPKEGFWLSYELDSKAGFRHFAQQACLGGAVALPEGYIVPDVETALEAMAHLAREGRGCVLKTSQGTAGFGMFQVPTVLDAAGRARQLREIRSRMRFDSRWACGPLVVESLVEGPAGEAPLAVTADFEVTEEGVVRYLGGGRMRVRKGQFYEGVVCGRGSLPMEIEARMHAAGTEVGAAAAARGYRGLFDLDFVVSADGALLVTEMNARRASPSHAFAIARRLRGAQWQDSSAVLANDHCTLTGSCDLVYGHVREAVRRFRCDALSRTASVVPTIVSHSLRRSVPYLGYAIVADTADEAGEAAARFESHLAQACGLSGRGSGPAEADR